MKIRCQSDYLITDNVKDFRNAELIFDSLKIVTPADFVKLWRKRHGYGNCGENVMATANVLTLRVPAELKRRIALMAEEQGVSINPLAMYIFTKEIGNLEAGQNLAKYWQGHSKADILRGFDEVVVKVKNRDLPEWDKVDT